MHIHCTLYVRTRLEAFDHDIISRFETSVVPDVGDEVCLMFPTPRVFRVLRRRLAVYVASPVGRLDTAELWCDEIHDNAPPTTR